MPRVVLAPDKFKGTLTSPEVAAALARGIRRVRPDADILAVPVADGGDGTLAVALAAGYTLTPLTTQGPTGEPLTSGYARRGNTAVIELAHTSGLTRLPNGTPAPLTATTYGTGQLLAAALAAGCTHLILGIGGSASTDGGRGLIEALTQGNVPAGTPLSSTSTPESAFAGRLGVDLVALRERLRGVRVVVACDVDNPLTGVNGAAAVYGPQKGASPAQVRELDARLSAWADEVAAVTGRDLRDVPGAGAAGGVGFAAVALLGAELRPGIELVLEMVGFEPEGADLVVTGEGALDEQTLHGKAVAGVAAAAGGGVPVVAVCGVNRLSGEQLEGIGVRGVYALTEVEPDVRRCLAEPGPLLERIGERIAMEHLTMKREGVG